MIKMYIVAGELDNTTNNLAFNILIVSNQLRAELLTTYLMQI